MAKKRNDNQTINISDELLKGEGDSLMSNGLSENGKPIDEVVEEANKKIAERDKKSREVYEKSKPTQMGLF